MEKLGIQNILKVVEVIASVANVGDKFGADGHTSRWNHLVGLGPAILSLNGINFKAVLPELKDLDAAEREQVRQKFAGVLDLKDDALEAVIEDGIALIEEVAATVEHVGAFVKKAKGL